MWCYHTILKIKLIDKKTNEAVLNRIKEKRVLWYTKKLEELK